MRVSTLFAIFGVLTAVAVALLVWRIQRPTIVVEIDAFAAEQIDWDGLDPRLATFIREVQAGHIAGSTASDHQDVLELALKVDVREHDTHYEFPPLATPRTRPDGILCWPRLSVQVNNDSGSIEEVYLMEFCF